MGFTFAERTKGPPKHFVYWLRSNPREPSHQCGFSERARRRDGLLVIFPRHFAL